VAAQALFVFDWESFRVRVLSFDYGRVYWQFRFIERKVPVAHDPKIERLWF